MKEPLEFPESELIPIRESELKSNLKLMSRDERTKELIEEDLDYTNITSESIENMVK